MADGDNGPIVVLHRTPNRGLRSVGWTTGSVIHFRWAGGGGTRKIERLGGPRFPACPFPEDLLIEMFGIPSRLAYYDVLKDFEGQIVAIRESARDPFTPIITKNGVHRLDRRISGPRFWKHAHLAVSDADGDIILGNKNNNALTVVRQVPNMEPLLAMTWLTLDRLFTSETGAG